MTPPEFGEGDLPENECEAALLRRFTLIFGISWGCLCALLRQPHL